METKFTKGKWKVRDNVDENYYIETCSGGLIAEVSDGEIDDVKIHMDVIEANAKLIAAAPEMFEALEHILEYWNRDRNDSAMHDALWHIIETAEKALKKATE